MIVIADLHLGKVQDTVPKNGLPSRVWDLKQRVSEAIDVCRQHDESLVLAGDIFDSTHPSPWMIDVFLELMKQTTTETFLLLGNHDCGVEYHSLQYVQGLLAHVHLINEPQFRVIDGMKTALLPHMPRVKMEAAVEKYGSYMDYALHCVKEEVDVVVSHAHISGAKNSSDVEIEAGEALHFDPSDFFKFKLGIFGHIHKHQVLRRGKILYTGPVVTNSFDEAEQIKGFVSVEKDGEKLDWQFVPYEYEETAYKHVVIDLVSKDTLDLSPTKLKKMAEGKLLKVSVYAKDLMMVNEGEIRTAFKEVGGQVVRFETIHCNEIGEIEDDTVDDVFETINYRPVLKEYVKTKKLPEAEEKLAVKLGYEIIAEVLDVERITN